jgi:hypothetical protein
MINFTIYFFFVLFDGFKLGVFPGVLLLSLRLLSGLPVESAIGFGPGFNGILFYLLSKFIKNNSFFFSKPKIYYKM